MLLAQAATESFELLTLLALEKPWIRDARR